MKAARLSTAQGVEKINCWSSAVSVRTAQDSDPELNTHFNFCWTSQPWQGKQALEDFDRQAGNEQVRTMSSATALLHFHCQAQAFARTVCWESGTPLLTQSSHMVPRAWTCRDRAVPCDFKGNCQGLVSHKEGPHSTTSHTFFPRKGLCWHRSQQQGRCYLLPFSASQKISQFRSGTDAGRPKQGSLITCLHTYNKNLSCVIHRWKRFGKQIQKEGNLSGNISTPSWSIHWTWRAGIVSWPLWESPACPWERMGRGRSKGCLACKAARSPKSRWGR